MNNHFRERYFLSKHDSKDIDGENNMACHDQVTIIPDRGIKKKQLCIEIRKMEKNMILLKNIQYTPLKLKNR